MHSVFEGQYCRKPKQNLSGASTQQRRDDLLHKAHLDRMRREENRKRNQCSIRIQSYVRSFLVRQRAKAELRYCFDEVFNNFIRNNKLSDHEYDVFINDLVSKLIFFYNQDKDVDRLVSLSQKIILRPDNIIKLSSCKHNNWNGKLKKILLFHLKLTFPIRETSQSHLRMLDMWTNERTFTKYIKDVKGKELVNEILSYLLQNGYFEYLKNVIIEKVPPMIEPRIEPPTPYCASLLEFIQRPLNLAFEYPKTTFSKLCTEQFYITFLAQELSEPMRFFILPNLSAYPHFPYQELIDMLAIAPLTRQQQSFNSWLLFSVVRLFKPNYLKSCDEEQVTKFVTVLSLLTSNICKYNFKTIKDSDDDCDSSDSEDSDDEMDPTQRLSTLEVQVLEDTSALLNQYDMVQQIISNSLLHQNSTYGEQIIQSLSIICYHLLSARKSGLHEYKLLCSLALSSQFLHKLWYIISTRKQQSVFNTSATYINRITCGINLTMSEMEFILPMLTTFCSLLTLLITTLHDNEFYRDGEEMGEELTTSPMPFSLPEMVKISDVMKEMIVGLIELAYPDVQNNFNTSIKTQSSFQPKDKVFENTGFSFGPNTTPLIQPQLSRSYSTTSSFQQELVPRSVATNGVKNMWYQLFKITITLLRQLYARDVARRFCPEGMWVSSRINIVNIDKPSDIRRMFRRRLTRPFHFTRYTREDLEIGPPITNRELRSLTVIKKIPFLLPFQERVVLFQNNVMKDKERSQGEARYAHRDRLLDISVRRNYMYEDAFEELSPNNVPDLRLLLRVEMKNVLGAMEAGIDGGGVTREFLTELLKTAFDPNRGFFTLTIDNQLYPNPNVALLHPDYQKHYYFIGRVLGKAMYESLLVELPLAEFFLSKLVNPHQDVSIHQLASLDPEIYKNLLFLKKYDGNVADLGLDFTLVVDELGETKIKELKANGANIMVTNENKIEYIHLVADYKLNKQINIQNSAFKNGMSDLIQLDWLHMFSNKELQILISGSETPLDLDNLKYYVKYSGGYEENHPTIQYFWRAMEEFSDDEKRMLLKFVTSCSRQPLFGFKDLDPPFCIQRVVGSEDRLPTASTCMNLLKLPEFTDFQMLKDKVLYAIKAGAGFELS